MWIALKGPLKKRKVKTECPLSGKRFRRLVRLSHGLSFMITDGTFGVNLFFRDYLTWPALPKLVQVLS